MISGETRFAVMLGTPVRQVKTPAAFNAWAAEGGVDAVLIPMEIPAAGLAATLGALRSWTNCIGAVVTYPHKQAVVAALDSATDEVGVVGAANVIRRGTDGRLHGGMTDGLGFVAALRANRFDPRGVDVRLIGAGGAGAAIALALVDAGAGRIVLHNTDESRRRGLIERLAAARREAHVTVAEPADFACRLIVNATPVGMSGDAAQPLPLDDLDPRCFVADIVPSPAETPWVLEARRRGHRTQTGPEMVACQLPAVVAHLMPGTWKSSA